MTLAEFEDECEVESHRLRNAGWTTADIEGLLADWPGILLREVGNLAREARLLVESGATPVQARQWLRDLYNPVDGQLVITDETIERCTVDGPTGQPARDVVHAYVQAAGGDHETALLAIRAGMTLNELAQGIASGRCSRDTVAVLAGLRAGPGGVRS